MAVAFDAPELALGTQQPGYAPKSCNWYLHTNSPAALPAEIPTDGLPSIQELYVADDLAAAGKRLKSGEL